jgi:hypothetical protein
LKPEYITMVFMNRPVSHAHGKWNLYLYFKTEILYRLFPTSRK